MIADELLIVEFANSDKLYVGGFPLICLSDA